jgi:hypothetical protein
VLVFAMVTCDFRGAGPGEGEEVLIGQLPVEQLNNSAEEQLDTAPADAVADESPQDADQMLEVETPLDAEQGEFSFDVSLSDLTPSGSAAAGASISALSGGGGALGEGASFMGVHAKGTRFCIIADRSGSMEGAKLDYLKEEILETLTTMRSRGRFQLVLFHSRATPYPQAGWRHPRRDRAAVATWLGTITAGGGTNPTPAFELALNLEPRPDAVFFMTDGQFDDEVVDEVAQLNRMGGRRVPIHTISFMDTSAEALMRKIASDSGGRYRHVSEF